MMVNSYKSNLVGASKLKSLLTTVWADDPLTSLPRTQQAGPYFWANNPIELRHCCGVMRIYWFILMQVFEATMSKKASYEAVYIPRKSQKFQSCVRIYLLLVFMAPMRCKKILFEELCNFPIRLAILQEFPFPFLYLLFLSWKLYSVNYLNPFNRNL